MLKNVLHLCSEKSWRGGENQTLLLANGLLKHRVQSFFVCPEQSEMQKRVGDLFPVCTIRFKSSHLFKAALKVARFCDIHEVQIMDAQSSKAHTLGLLVRLLRPKVKLVVHRRVDYLVAQQWFGRLKYHSKKVDCYIAISHKIKNVLMESGVDRDRISVVRSAVSAAPYQNIDKGEAARKWRNYFNISEDKILVLTAAAISEQKAIDVLLNAVALLSSEEKNKFHFVIAGTGPLQKEMKLLAGKLNLNSCVTFAGFIEDIKSLTVAADIFFLTSRDEGLGTSLLEAALANTCILASRAGGIPEIVQHRETGLLFENENSAEARDHLLDLARSPETRTELASAGYAYVEEHFCIEKMIQGNLKVYQNVVN